jgi:transcriptional regulator with XRE-family HTH domain
MMFFSMRTSVTTTETSVATAATPRKGSLAGDVRTWLERALARREVSVSALAKRAKVARQTVHRYLNEEVEAPEMETVTALAVALGIAVPRLGLVWQEVEDLPGYAAGLADGQRAAAEAVRALDLTNAAHAIRIAGIVTPPPEQSPTPLPPPASQHPPRRRSRG